MKQQGNLDPRTYFHFLSVHERIRSVAENGNEDITCIKMIYNHFLWLRYSIIMIKLFIKEKIMTLPCLILRPPKIDHFILKTRDIIIQNYHNNVV